MAETTITRRIQWAHTDASGWYHNTAVLLLIEEAEHVLFDELGILDEIISTVPRVRVEVDFRSFLRFWDEVEILVRVEEVGRTSITERFELRRDGALCAEARVVAVHVDAEGKPQPWTEEHRRLLAGGAPAVG